MKLKTTLLAAAVAFLTVGAQAAEFRSADIHNADDYPTVLAVKHMSTVLEKLSGGKQIDTTSREFVLCTRSRCSTRARWAPRRKPSTR